MHQAMHQLRESVRAAVKMLEGCDYLPGQRAKQLLELELRNTANISNEQLLDNLATKQNRRFIRLLEEFVEDLESRGEAQMMSVNAVLERVNEILYSRGD